MIPIRLEPCNSNSSCVFEVVAVLLIAGLGFFRRLRAAHRKRLSALSIFDPPITAQSRAHYPRCQEQRSNRNGDAGSEDHLLSLS